MKTLYESYKVLRFFLSLFTFSTTSKSSILYKIYRGLVLLLFLEMSLYRFYLLSKFNPTTENFENHSAIATLLMVSLDFCGTLVVNTCFLVYQIFFKKRSFEVFESLRRIDVSALNFCGLKFNYRKRFLTLSTLSLFLLGHCFLEAYLGQSGIESTILRITTSISSFFSFQIFFITFLLISLCNEVRERLKSLNSLLLVKKLHNEDFLMIFRLASEAMKRTRDFFAVEISIIISNFKIFM